MLQYRTSVTFSTFLFCLFGQFKSTAFAFNSAHSVIIFAKFEILIFPRLIIHSVIHTANTLNQLDWRGNQIFRLKRHEIFMGMMRSITTRTQPISSVIELIFSKKVSGPTRLCIYAHRKIRIQSMYTADSKIQIYKYSLFHLWLS